MPYLVRSISKVLPCADQIATEIGIESGSISTESDRSPGGAWALDQLRESCFGRASHLDHGCEQRSCSFEQAGDGS